MPAVILALVGLVVGTLAGLVFFGGLWWTSHRMLSSTRPGLLVAASLLVRMGIVATALVLLARVDVAMFAAGVVGVLLARIALTRSAVLGRLPRPGVDPGTSEAGR